MQIARSKPTLIIIDGILDYVKENDKQIKITNLLPKIFINKSFGSAMHQHHQLDWAEVDGALLVAILAEFCELLTPLRLDPEKLFLDIA